MESIQNQLPTDTNYKERHQSNSATEEQSEEGKVKEICFFLHKGWLAFLRDKIFRQSGLWMPED